VHIKDLLDLVRAFVAFRCRLDSAIKAARFNVDEVDAGSDIPLPLLTLLALGPLLLFMVIGRFNKFDFESGSRVECIEEFVTASPSFTGFSINRYLVVIRLVGCASFLVG